VTDHSTWLDRDWPADGPSGGWNLTHDPADYRTPGGTVTIFRNWDDGSFQVVADYDAAPSDWTAAHAELERLDLTVLGQPDEWDCWVFRPSRHSLNL
jgi:hypothetical protein